MKTSLRARLTWSFLLVIVATAGLVVLLANRITAERFTVYVSNAGQIQARVLAPLFADYYAQVGHWAGVEALLADSADTPGGMMGRGRRGNGMMMGSMQSMMQSGHERLLLADASGKVVADSAGQSNGAQLSAADLAKGAPIVVGDRQVGTLVVASGLGTLTSDQSAFLSQINGLMILAALGAGIAVLLVGAWQARRIVAPVRALAAAAHRIAAGDLSQRISVASGDELGEMATAFNTMAAQLEQQHELRRRAMADIAHELRTPLSVLRIDLESIEDGLTEPTPQVVARLQDEVALLNRLVEDLRMLSLAEAGELHMDIEPLDVGELVQSTLERVNGAAREKGVALSADLSQPLSPVAGDRQRLTQVLLNLLSNALRHTPAGGQILVRARQTGGEVQVSVLDNGEGIPPAELPHVFERFYRADRARSREAGGTGLGLTIARSLVQAHGGRMWAESPPQAEGQGSVFTFALPALREN
jgi:signal transduction histidine kinase